jgi:hypothetical protein
MTRPHMPTSLDDLSYEPVSNKRGVQEDSVSSGSDDEDELVRRPG